MRLQKAARTTGGSDLTAKESTTRREYLSRFLVSWFCLKRNTEF